MHVSIAAGCTEGAPVILILTGAEKGREKLLTELDDLKGFASFALIGGLDWNRDLSPWPAAAAWKGTPDFSGGADAFLKEITGEGLTQIREALGYEPPWYGIAGYSLAGLFAVYSLYRTDVFKRAVSASGSMWFDGFRDFVMRSSFAGKPDRVYFSLGNRESGTRNRRVAAVEDDTQAVCRHYQSFGPESVFEKNPGNHFQDPEKRLVKGIRWILRPGFSFRAIFPDEYGQAAQIERICFPADEAVPEEAMILKAQTAPDLFLVAADPDTGRLAGFLNGLATDEEHLRDVFYTDASLHKPDGRNVMLLGLDVLPEYRGRHLASELMRRYVQREKMRGREKLILTCLEDRIPMYLKMGFADRGISESQWGGGKYHEMVYCLSSQ